MLKKLTFLVFILFSFSVTYPQITVNGTLDESSYQSVATKLNSNSGFGPDINITEIVYYPDYTNSILYIGLKGKLNTGSSDGFGLWINIAGSGSPTGTAANNSLGGISGAGHYMENGDNPNFRADFEVDYMFAINPGSSTTNCYVNAASRVGTPAGVYLGNCGQSGSSLDYSTTGTVFANGYTITFAFNNGGGSNQGFEIKIPFGAIGATSSMEINMFAFVVSSTAYFSDVTVPGNITGGNPGFNPNFSALSGGSFNSGNKPLPVELSSFTASVVGNNVQLNWSTATETNNFGFAIQRISFDNKINGSSIWEEIGFVKGNGNSSAVKNYAFIDFNPVNGKSYYRLKQIDHNGSFEYSKEVEVDYQIITQFELFQNYPNPFNPVTNIKYSIPESGIGDVYTTLKVYDFLGREVSTLVNESKPAGVYEIQFNGSNLSSGVYTYRLESNGISQTRKFVLMK